MKLCKVPAYCETNSFRLHSNISIYLRCMIGKTVPRHLFSTSPPDAIFLFMAYCNTVLHWEPTWYIMYNLSVCVDAVAENILLLCTCCVVKERQKQGKRDHKATYILAITITIMVFIKPSGSSVHIRQLCSLLLHPVKRKMREMCIYVT